MQVYDSLNRPPRTDYPVRLILRLSLRLTLTLRHANAGAKQLHYCISSRSKMVVNVMATMTLKVRASRVRLKEYQPVAFRHHYIVRTTGYRMAWQGTAWHARHNTTILVHTSGRTLEGQRGLKTCPDGTCPLVKTMTRSCSSLASSRVISGARRECEWKSK